MGQKSDDCKTTLSEAFIQFQIQVKKKEMQEFKNETSLLEAKNQRLIELRDQLREEQLGHIRTLRKQAKEQERKLNQSEQANKEQVEHALQHDVEMSHRQEEELAELRQQLTGLETQVMELRAQQQVLLEYKSIGRALHQRQIQDLQSELSTMQQDFQEMSENIQYSRDATFNEINKKKSQMIDEEKQLATEELLHLGPLEQKLLTVMGQAMTLHPMPSDSEGSGTSTHLDFLETPDWSLTTSIIRNQFP